MRTALTAMAISAVLAGAAKRAPPVTLNGPSSASSVTPLILEKNEGERRAWRPIEGAKGWNAVPGPFILKVDRHNGGSSPFGFGHEDLPPGERIGWPRPP